MKWSLLVGLLVLSAGAFAQERVQCGVSIVDRYSGRVIQPLLDRGADCAWAFDTCDDTIYYNRLDAVCERMTWDEIRYYMQPRRPYYYPAPSTTVEVRIPGASTTTTTTTYEEYDERTNRWVPSRTNAPAPARPRMQPLRPNPTPAPTPATVRPTPTTTPTRPTSNNSGVPDPGSQGNTIPNPPGTRP